MYVIISVLKKTMKVKRSDDNSMQERFKTLKNTICALYINTLYFLKICCGHVTQLLSYCLTLYSTGVIQYFADWLIEV